jgi:hypothetical protein
MACFVLFWALLVAAPNAAAAPQAGFDCRTLLSGNWNAPATWENCGGGAPGADDNAFIQAGHTVTLTQDEAVNDLHISTGTTSATAGGEGIVALGDYNLSLYGALSCYFAPVGTTPGSPTTTVHANALTMNIGGPGRLRVVGASRNLTNSGEWGIPASSPTNIATIEIAADADATIVLGTGMKAGVWSLVSGTLDTNGYRLAADLGAAGTGDVTVGADATLVSSSSTSTAPIMSRTTNTSNGAAGAFTLDGRLTLKGATPHIGMTAITLNGVVEYAGASQTLLQGTGGGAAPTVYGALVLTNTGTKTLPANTTVNTRLVRGGASSLNLGGHALTYGAAATLEYAGTAAQTTGPELPAAIAGLQINNAAGVTLNADLTVNTLLDLAAGDLTIGAFTLDLGAAANCSGAGDALGAVRRAAVVAGSVYCFGHPLVSAGVNAGSTPPSSLTVTLARGSAPFAGAVLRQYSVDAPGFAGVATLRLHFRSDELNGNNAADLVLWRYDGVRWLAQAPSSRDADSLTKNDVTAFSDWALAANGDSTAVDVSTFAAQRSGDDTVLTWSTASEAELVGFHLHRGASIDGPGARLTDQMIPARHAGQIAGAAYTWTDRATDTAAGYYWLELVHLQGGATWLGPVRATAAPVYLPVIITEHATRNTTKPEARPHAPILHNQA